MQVKIKDVREHHGVVGVSGIVMSTSDLQSQESIELGLLLYVLNNSLKKSGTKEQKAILNPNPERRCLMLRDIELQHLKQMIGVWRNTHPTWNWSLDLSEMTVVQGDEGVAHEAVSSLLSA